MNYTLKFLRETETSIAFLEIMTFGSIGSDHYRINKFLYSKNFFRGNKLYSNPNTFELKQS